MSSYVSRQCWNDGDDGNDEKDDDDDEEEEEEEEEGRRRRVDGYSGFACVEWLCVSVYYFARCEDCLTNSISTYAYTNPAIST